MSVTTTSELYGDVDTSAPISSFRVKRFALMLRLIDTVIAQKGKAHILDIGGTADYWLKLEPLWKGRELSFTLVNLQAEPVRDPRFVSRAGDACAMPEFADNSFDIVHSNSVIEHVGRWKQMRAMAQECARLAPRYFVQTPAFGFPVEPHFRTPFYHWLPQPIRIWLSMKMPLGYYPKAETVDDAMRFVEDAILLDARRMRALFPAPARLEKERVFGLTKSFIAIRD